MLVITRREGERVIIGGGDSGIPEIAIKVLTTASGRTSLGIDAPREVPVHRENVRDKIVSQEGTVRPGLSIGRSSGISMSTAGIHRRARGGK